MGQIKKGMLTVLLLLLSSRFLVAQTLPDFDLIKLDVPADYKKAAPFALQTANFFMIVPYKDTEKDKERSKAIDFLAKWVNGMHEYPFSFTDIQKKITKSDIGLLQMYLAAMIKSAVTNKEAAKDGSILKLNAISLLISYCENKGNNLKMNKKLKQLAEAKAKGELATALEEMLK